MYEMKELGDNWKEDEVTGLITPSTQVEVKLPGLGGPDKYKVVGGIYIPNHRPLVGDFPRTNPTRPGLGTPPRVNPTRIYDPTPRPSIYPDGGLDKILPTIPPLMPRPHPVIYV